ncbi:LSM14 family protein trailer hitch isoform X3 [Rhynchophorus ferrugineus]|uniref:LSM14 family protein trailer hitch isoform X3 n=1 Tax=Rhynchophorus ferrugineus TaxID=354439 RepID=UPI003FCD8A49
MTSGMPELGSKISLISKADIRYEGRLFTVDPQECTIALASVRSFGTENREAQFPVPAQNQVYDYILFRGSDIKDISIVNSVPHTQPLNDPAIMQLSVPPSLGPQQFQQHPILGHMTHAPYSTFMPMGGLAGSGTSGLPATGMNRAGLAPGSKPSELIIPHGAPPDVGVAPSSILSPPLPTPVGEPPRPNDHPDLIGGGAAASRSTTPASVGSRKSVSVDQGTQAGGSQQRDGNKQVKPIQPPKGQQNRNKSRDRKNSQNRADNHDHRSQQYIQQNRGRQQHQNNQQGYQQRGGWNNQRNMTRGRGRSRGGPFRSGGQSGQIGANKKNTLKFDKDYDFEQANTAFEELKNKLAKVKLEEAAGTSKNEVNGSGVEPDKKDDSGNETGAGETEQDEEHEVFYDKNKSFFDKISCEAVERAKGKMQRTDWRKERKLNSETFGVAATRRGSYRGRAGFRGGYRGSFRGNYRQPNQQQRRNSEPQNSQQNQQGSKSTRPVYCPLSNEEALAKIKQDEGSKLQQGQENSVIIDDIEKVTHDLAVTDESETLISDPKTDLILKEKINVIDEKSTVLDEKDIKETEKIVVDDPPACVVKP